MASWQRGSCYVAFQVHLTDHSYRHTSKDVARLKIDTAVINYITLLDNAPKYIHTCAYIADTIIGSGAFGLGDQIAPNAD